MNPEEFVEQLLKNDYNNFKATLKNDINGYQKCIRDKKGKKYYISFYYHPEITFNKDSVIRSSIEVEIQFNKIHKK